MFLFLCPKSPTDLRGLQRNGPVSPYFSRGMFGPAMVLGWKGLIFAGESPVPWQGKGRDRRAVRRRRGQVGLILSLVGKTQGAWVGITQASTTLTKMES